jgi:hypothetical protein
LLVVHLCSERVDSLMISVCLRLLRQGAGATLTGVLSPSRVS